MKHLFTMITLCLFATVPMAAQHKMLMHDRPLAPNPEMEDMQRPMQNVYERTPEQEAEKRTELMTRELNLDSAQIVAIYNIHLKYAKLRRISNTRAENLERMNLLTTEIQAVLTKEQFDLFMNKQVDVAPHHRAMSMPQHNERQPAEND